MTRDLFSPYLQDRGGRRRVKDRRFRVSVLYTPEKRTGLHRRSGWDRRSILIALLKGANRRKYQIGNFE